MHSVKEISNYFISKLDASKGDSITPLKLQKLVYYAQAWYYTLFDKKLFDDKIEAWAHGPVSPKLYKEYRNYGMYTPINVSKENITTPKFSEKVLNVLEDVNTIYGEHSGTYLEELTHSEDPWKIARGNTPSFEKSNKEITLKSMKDYYSSL